MNDTIQVYINRFCEKIGVTELHPPVEDALRELLDDVISDVEAAFITDADLDFDEDSVTTSIENLDDDIDDADGGCHVDDENTVDGIEDDASLVSVDDDID